MYKIFKEEWREIQGSKGKYNISNTGIVRRNKQIVESKGSYRVLPEREVKRECRGRIPRACIQMDGKSKSINIPKLVLEEFKQIKVENYKEIHYKDGNSNNASLDNLVYIKRKNTEEKAKMFIDYIINNCCSREQCGKHFGTTGNYVTCVINKSSLGEKHRDELIVIGEANRKTANKNVKESPCIKKSKGKKESPKSKIFLRFLKGRRSIKRDEIIDNLFMYNIDFTTKQIVSGLNRKGIKVIY